jgi:hypothetical protein
MQYLLGGMFGRACKSLGSAEELGKVAAEVGDLREALTDKLAGLLATAAGGFPAVSDNLWLGQDEAQVRASSGAHACTLSPWPSVCLVFAHRIGGPLKLAPRPKRRCLVLRRPAPAAAFPPSTVLPGCHAVQAIESALAPKLEKTKAAVEELLFEVVTLEVGAPGVASGGEWVAEWGSGVVGGASACPQRARLAKTLAASWPSFAL